jgi:hypothetical protein
LKETIFETSKIGAAWEKIDTVVSLYNPVLFHSKNSDEGLIEISWLGLFKSSKKSG